MRTEQKINKLLKDYDCNNINQYFDIILESYHNGQRKQCNEQFKVLPIKERKCFLGYAMALHEWNHDNVEFQFFLSIL